MVLTVKTGRDDAILLLRAWMERGCLLRCNFEFVSFAACLRARIRALSPDKVELISDDTFNELVVPLGGKVEFGTGDFRDQSPDEAATYDMCLAIYLPVKDAEPEVLTFIEVKEDD